MAKPERRPDESLIEWLWRCEAVRRAAAADADGWGATAADGVTEAIRRHDEVAEAAALARLAADNPLLADAWSRLGWEHRPKAKEADRIRAHALGVAL